MSQEGTTLGEYFYKRIGSFDCPINFVACFVAQYFQATNKRQIGYKPCKNFDLFSGICFIETPFVILHWLYRFYI